MSALVPIRGSDPTEGIRALVSGYAAPIRSKKILTVLQAYTDDSAAQTGDQRLFLAGYIHTADAWTAFSDNWAAALSREPRIGHLHMVEAQNLRGEFKGWSASERDKKLDLMATVIELFEPISFEFSVDRRSFYENVKGITPRGLATPHFTATFHTIAGVARFVTERVGLDVPIDFIFDEQCGVSEHVNLFFSSMKKNLPPRAQAVINGNPIFRSDLHVLPIQAADMLAWHLRREHEYGAGPWKTLPMADRLRNPKGHMSARVDAPMLEEWGKFFRSMSKISAPPVTKGEWRLFKKALRALDALGIEPPGPEDLDRLIEFARSRTG